MKTMGASVARLVAGLHDRNRTIFTVGEASAILASPPNIVSNLLAKAQSRGIVTRLRRGTYVLVPFELGSEASYAGDPLLVACRLVGSSCYLSHGTAMSIHGMTTRPRLVVTVSSMTRAKVMSAQGTEIRVVSVGKGESFGIGRHWVTASDPVCVSDPERTIVDGLRRPDLCGGYAEVDLGAWMARGRLDPRKLVDYALRIGVRAVAARLGYLMDSCRMGTDGDRAALQRRVTRTYHPLDPSLPEDGKYDHVWRLRLNVKQAEIEADRTT